LIRSMTGFGKGKGVFKNGQVRIEVKTFNHKYLELSCKIPEFLQTFEEQIKKTIRKKVKRGKLYLWITYESGDDSLGVAIDEKKLRRYYNLLKGIKKKFNLKGDLTLDQLLSLPDVITSKPKQENTRTLWRHTSAALDDALESLLKMRKKEGAALYKDLTQRCKNITKSLNKIKLLLPREITRYRSKLKKKIGSSSDKNGFRRERIEAEVALFAKNCDVSEELTRIAAHIDNFKSTLKGSSESGKVLDFIAQELHREINTVGAKSSDFMISREVIFIKGEVEKIREQVQNIE